MKAPVSWIRDYAPLPEQVSVDELAEAFINLGLNVERIEKAGADASGPVVVGRVLSIVDEPQKNGKTIRWCRVDVGEHNDPADGDVPASRGIVCGAHNFAEGDLVVVALPGSTLAGGFQIAARKTYGHVSDGMICAEDELGVGHDHTGIIVLPAEHDGRALVPGEEALPLLAQPDQVLDIDVTPDMGYCLSIRGLAREAALAFATTYTDVSALPTPPVSEAGYPVVLDDPGCSLFAAVSVTGADPTRPTPAWMKARLEMAGMRSLGLIIDISNYVMLETGQPLHFYDADRVAGSIVARAARAGETLVTLDDQTRTLDPEDLLITDDSGPIGLAGVMGGASTEVHDATTNVLIEAACFDPVRISRTFRRHKLPSEASKRFERGTDPDGAYAAAHRAADLLAELAGGSVEPAETLAGAVPAMPTQRIAASLATEVLGVEVDLAHVLEILDDVGCTTAVEGDDVLITPPTWRPDLRDPYDYVEEIGRKIGFEVIPSVGPIAPPGRGLTRSQQARRRINQAVAAQGFVELITLPFLGADQLDRLGLPEDDPRRATVRLANPLADTTPFLRTSLLPGLFAAVATNTSRGNDDLALYEAGLVFRAKEPAVAPRPSVEQRPSKDEIAALDAALADQPRRLAAVLCGQWRRAGWQGPAIAADWTHAVAFAEAAAEAVGLTLTRRADQHAPWHPGRCAALYAGDVLVGHAGELHPRVIAAYGLPERTCAVEVGLDLLIEAAPQTGTLAALSPFPVAKEDVALIVDADVPAAEVADALREGAGELLESLALFDVYTGPQVGEGKKSLAYALRFRAPGLRGCLS